jgi:hypothetical protein
MLDVGHCREGLLSAHSIARLAAVALPMALSGCPALLSDDFRTVPDDGGMDALTEVRDVATSVEATADGAPFDAGAEVASDDAGSDAKEAGSDASVARSDANDAGSDVGPTCASNVLTPHAAVASSVNGAGVAGSAIDGNFATRWESTQMVDPQWIYVDFGAPVFISRIQIAWETACGSNYELQTSNDASTWTTIRSIVGNTNGGPAPVDWSTAVDHQRLVGGGRYLRIIGTVRCTGNGYSIWEMRVFGDTNATCHP